MSAGIWNGSRSVSNRSIFERFRKSMFRARLFLRELLFFPAKIANNRFEQMFALTEYKNTKSQVCLTLYI